MDTYRSVRWIAEVVRSSTGSESVSTIANTPEATSARTAASDKASRTGIRVWDLIDSDRLRTKLADAVMRKNSLITRVYGGQSFNDAALYEEYAAYGERIAPFVCDASRLLYEALSKGARILFEGAHATLLDIDHGTYPFVTSSACVAGAACVGTGVGPTKIDRVIGAVKAYTTRVGAGPCPTEQDNAVGELIRERGIEDGTATGRSRRCGWFDAVAVRRAARINGASAIAVTLLDVLSGFEKLSICTHYRIDGQDASEFPSDTELLARATPVYAQLPGWREEIGDVRRFEDLPVNAQRYVEEIERMVGVPTSFISVGRDRDAAITRAV